MSRDRTLELWEQELRHSHYRLRAAPDRGQCVDVEGLLLASTFEPVFSRAHGRPVGHRGLSRVLADSGFLGIGEAAAELQRRDVADRTAAIAPGLHMTNYRIYRARTAERGWLFLPVPALVHSHPSLWPPLPQDLFGSELYAPNDIVLEISVNAAGADSLQEFTRYHQALGFIVALTDFGHTQADLAAVWKVQADIVLIPLAGIRELTASHNQIRALAALCRLLHESGSMVALGGVDSETDLRTALATEADLLQGSWARYADAIARERPPAAVDQQLRQALESSLDRFTAGGTFESACEPLLGEAGVLRCYLLDGSGTQLADNLSPVGVRSDARYWPLANAVGASWNHRAYFRSALEHPGQLMTTGPYFSLPDGGHCLTLSIATRRDEQNFVLCCDIIEATSA